MSTWKEKRSMIGGVALVAFLLIILGIEMAGIVSGYLDFMSEGLLVGAVIFTIGVIIVAAYVLYYD